MYRGTTPNIVIYIPDKVDAENITALKFMMAQDGKVVITKELSQFTKDGQKFSLRLTITETNSLDASADKNEWQLRGKIGDIYFASKKVEFDVDDVLDGGVEFNA